MPPRGQVCENGRHPNPPGAMMTDSLMVQTAEASDTPALAGGPPPIADLLDTVEALIADIQCALMETLTPREFRLVQDLRDATQVATVAWCAAAARGDQ
jgi:hypothetical protein